MGRAMSDFAIQVRLKTLAGATLYDLHDEANGLEVLAPIGMSSEQWRRSVETGRYVDGSTLIVAGGLSARCA